MAVAESSGVVKLNYLQIWFERSPTCAFKLKNKNFKNINPN